MKKKWLFIFNPGAAKKPPVTKKKTPVPPLLRSLRFMKSTNCRQGIVQKY